LEKILSFRKRINEVDEQILGFLKERVEICKIIGKIKREHGIPVKDYQREDELYKRIERRASELGLNPRDVKAVYQKIVDMCTHVQE